MAQISYKSLEDELVKLRFDNGKLREALIRIATSYDATKWIKDVAMGAMK